MRIGITSFNKIGPRSILATGRVFHYLADKLEADQFHDPDLIKEWAHNPDRELYDVLVCMNGIPTYCKARDELYQMFEEHAAAGKKIFWIGQDYNAKMRPQTKQIAEFLDSPHFKLVAAFEPKAWMSYAPREDQYEYINWNMLTFSDELPMVTEPEVPNSLLYYGAARENRTAQFAKYFATESSVERHFSAPSSLAVSALKKRIGVEMQGTEILNEGEENEEVNEYTYHECPHVNWVSLFNVNQVPNEVAKYAATIHIEDTSNQRWFCSLPNRVYEALSSGTLLLIDKDTVNSYIKSGYTEEEIAPFIVDGMDDVEKALANRLELLQLQRDTLIKENYWMSLNSSLNLFLDREGIPHNN